MPSSLESLAESSLNEKKNHKKQKQGESVYVVDPVHREKLLAAQGHMVTSPKAHLPHSREPPPHRVSGSPLQWPHPQTQSLANFMPHSPRKPGGSLSQAHPGHLCDSSPGNPHHHAVPISLSSSQPLLGPRSWHTQGPASVTP